MSIEVRKTGFERGVFAKKEISLGEVIEECPVIILSAHERGQVFMTRLSNYIFDWGRGRAGFALWYGSLYNHSYEPNAVYYADPVNELIVFKAIKSIKPGDEITVNYNCNPDDKSPLWFKVKDKQA